MLAYTGAASENDTKTRSANKTEVWAVSVAFTLACLPSGPVHAQQAIYVSGYDRIGEYSLTGTPINASLVSGNGLLDDNMGIGISGNNLYVANIDNNTVGEYNATTGATINASFLSGLSSPEGVAVSGGNIFIANTGNNTIGKYNTTGSLVSTLSLNGNQPLYPVVSGGNLYLSAGQFNNIGNEILEYTTSGTLIANPLISGLNNPNGIAISGSNLFIANAGAGTIAEYSTSGTLENAQLITGLNHPTALAIDGNNLYVTELPGIVGEYTTSGGTVNPDIISGLGTDPGGIVVVDAPETSTLALTALGAAAFFVFRGRSRNA